MNSWIPFALAAALVALAVAIVVNVRLRPVDRGVPASPRRRRGLGLPSRTPRFAVKGAETIDAVEGTVPRENGEVSIASYMNFLIVNGGVILPQYGDENDALAVRQVQEMFQDREVVGVQTREVAFGGGNIHCITQQQPRP